MAVQSSGSKDPPSHHLRFETKLKIFPGAYCRKPYSSPMVRSLPWKNTQHPAWVIGEAQDRQQHVEGWQDALHSPTPAPVPAVLFDENQHSFGLEEAWASRSFSQAEHCFRMKIMNNSGKTGFQMETKMH